LSSTVTHIIDDSDKRWRVVVELRRRQVAIVAEIPKDATIDEIVLFTENIRHSMRRKLAELAELAAGKGSHGETQGASESTVPGADAAGPAEEKAGPKGGGPQGGSNAPPAT
jgi:hypothetical protein